MKYYASLYQPGQPHRKLTSTEVDRLVMGHFDLRLGDDTSGKVITCVSVYAEHHLECEEVDVLHAGKYVAVWGQSNAADNGGQPNPEADQAAAAAGAELPPLVGPILIITATEDEPVSVARPWPPARTFFAVTINNAYLKQMGRGMFMIELTPMGQHTLSEGWQLAKESGLSAKTKLAELYGCRMRYLKHPTTVPIAPDALALLFDTVDKLMVWHTFPEEIAAVLRLYADSPGIATEVSGESMFYVNNQGTVTVEVATHRNFVDVQGNMNIGASVFDTSNPPMPEFPPYSPTCDHVRTGVALKPTALAYEDGENQWRLELKLAAASKSILVEQLRAVLHQIEQEGGEAGGGSGRKHDVHWTLSKEPLDDEHHVIL